MRVEARPSLLLVHRRPGSHHRTVAYLRAAGVACAEAVGAQEALVVLAALRFDYVLLDPPTPELEERLRACFPSVRAIPVGGDAGADGPGLPPEFEPDALLRRLR